MELLIDDMYQTGLNTSTPFRPFLASEKKAQDF